MDCVDAANAWSEAARRPTFLRRNLDKSTRDMGSLVSRQESLRNPKRPVSLENPRALKRQRIGIDGLDLAKKLQGSILTRKGHSAPERLEEPSSLEITFGGILDKYGDKHESLIPRRLDGVPVKTRCSVQIYHPTSECQNGTLTDVHEELLRVSQEGDIRTTWNPTTGHPETEINLPRSFIVPIRELYVPKPPAAKSRAASVASLSEISDSEDDSDELLDEGEYGLAKKYFCHVSFSTVRTRPWPPLGVDGEISQSSAIGKQLRHGHFNKRDLKLVSKTELLPLESLSMKVPLEIKLGPDRQTTQYQLALDAKWETPEITQPETEELETPNFVWKIELGGQAPSESKMGDCSCGICLAKLNSIRALHLHVRANHSQFIFTFTSPTIEEQDFVIAVSDRESTILPKVNTQIRNDSPLDIGSPVSNVPSVDMDAQVNKAPEVEILRSIFDFDDDLSTACSIATNTLPTPEPPCLQACSKLGQEPARDSSTSASVSELQSKTSSLNTTPDAGSESDGPIEPRKRTRVLNSRRTVIEEDEDEDFSCSSVEDATPMLVPKTAKPLYDIASKELLEPDKPLPPSTVSHDWRIRKQADLINSISDITLAEKEFINRWDPFIFGQKSTSKIFMPAILEEFINVNRRWLDDKQCRKQELLKHLSTLTMSGRIEEKCLWECLEICQNERISPPKVRQVRKSSTAVAREERSLIELWDAYARDKKPNSLEKFVSVSKTLRSSRSVHGSDGDSVAMLRLFLSYYKRTSMRDLLALDGIYYNSNFPFPTTEAESEYIRFFNSFKTNFDAPDGTDEELMFSFLADNTLWFYEDIQRFQWARKHLQELHWTKKITPKFRQKLVTYLETMESAHDSDSDSDMPDATIVNNLSSSPQTDPLNKGKGKETAAPATPTFAPSLINPDPLNAPRPRNVRAFGECECGGYARPGESVTCAAEHCIARTFHRACVPDAPPRGTVWYCSDCAATGLRQATKSQQLDRMDISA
ncbi:hypothetical protein V502_08119 [Pseudogymnoascus sp. VKM F-4520 (FW-2644)]|nr:hypothetical protein V502_08119 [Pseudogymnoascus sp. VKM F-4520 (FW-2644)]